MNRENFINQTWYRAIKVLFVSSFIIAEIMSISVANSIVLEERNLTYTYDELIYAGGKPANGSVDGQSDQQGSLTKLVLSGKNEMKPVDVYGNSITISDVNFQNLKSNIEKMIKVGVQNRELNLYTIWAFEETRQGKNIRSLPDNPVEKYKYKYNPLQRVAIYGLSFVTVLLFFWLISRTFFYIVLGENFLIINLKRINQNKEKDNESRI